MNPTVARVLSVLEHVPGDLELNVSMPALEKAVQDAEAAAGTGSSVIEAVINDAPSIFPNATYLTKAVKLLNTVLEVAKFFGYSLPAQAPQAV